MVRSHSITYKRPAFLGEELTAYTWVAGFSARQCPRKYLFWRAADQCVLAEAETLWVFVNLSTGRPARVPEDLRTAFDIVPDAAEVLELARGGA